jgi:glycosyltransferase involved in cell wall biosynthesis
VNLGSIFGVRKGLAVSFLGCDDLMLGGRLVSETSALAKLGILTTYNTFCGLATYAQFLLNEFSPGQIVVLAEEVPASKLAQPDASEVYRVWKRLTLDYSNLQQTISRLGLELLHINCQHTFFFPEPLRACLEPLRAQGLKVMATVHNPNAPSMYLKGLIAISDRLYVHSRENRIFLIANGAAPDSVRVIEHGVSIPQSKCKGEARQELSIAQDRRFILTYGFIRRHKGIEHILSAVHSFKENKAELHFYCLGDFHVEDDDSAEYFEELKHKVEEYEIADRVHFVRDFVPEEKLISYIFAADIVVFPYTSDWHETSGTLALALGCGAAVVTSSAPSFARFSDCVFQTAGGFPLDFALSAIYQSKTLENELRENARQWAKENSWSKVAAKYAQEYENFGVCLRLKDSAASPPAEEVPTVDFSKLL